MEEIQVKIKMMLNAQVYTIKIAKSDTILKLKKEVEKQAQIPPEIQNLAYKGRILSNEKLISDFNIENDQTIFLVKKYTSPPPSENKPTTASTTANTTTNTNINPNTSANNNKNQNPNNKTGNNQNPFMGMGGGQIPDLSQLSSLLRNINPNQINNMMHSMGGLGDFSGMGGLGGLGGSDWMSPQALGQLLRNPLCMQVMNNLIQNPEMIRMALNNPQTRQMAQNIPQTQALLNNPQIIQQILNPQMLQNMSNILSGMPNPQNNQNNNTSGTRNSNPNLNPLGLDINQLNKMLGNLQGMGGLGGTRNTGLGNNRGNTRTNDDNVDYKEKYKDQLAQLKEMGFINEETNIQVLKRCSGNVQFAVERLINMRG